jgi:hypothetical protein
MIEIYAGKTAMEKIKEHGFRQELFTSFLGSSGGPKWFCLYSLDKYLFGEFFEDRTTELNLIGSSAGAFRSACFAQKDPVKAIERLAKNYAETTYSDKAKPKEITEKARELLDTLFADSGAKEVIENQIFKAHFIVAKSNGLVKYDNKYVQGLGLLNSYLRNRRDRAKLKSQYERFVFQSPTSSLSFNDPDNIPTKIVNLTERNIKSALLASGSIPMVMEGIKNIPDAPKGMYRDGGIIDYHFDLNIKTSGLILYPHFNSQPKAGWFDKGSNRQPRQENYDKVVLICPSPEFVASLPYGKIPDRTDFTELNASTRIKYWKTVFSETQKTADTLSNWLDSGDIVKNIKPMPF